MSYLQKMEEWLMCNSDIAKRMNKINLAFSITAVHQISIYNGHMEYL